MATPWPALLRLAALRFGLAPEVFWRLSVVEWRALAEDAAPQTLTRTALDALVRAYPDGQP
ncbi:phage tail assembly chaperone [Caulobacter mirabilis]|uniref:Phage tail assembly chaperone n=1 Tax=Caulobacter mirabilis TaxID=69666 RepID=A0A2D2B3T3_9CAUL|nr:phage tail assembly chaperone [Caulobacter mirabilis]